MILTIEDIQSQSQSKSQKVKMNIKQYLKQEFIDAYPGGEFYHDGEGMVMVILPNAVITIRANE